MNLSKITIFNTYQENKYALSLKAFHNYFSFKIIKK